MTRLDLLRARLVRVRSPLPALVCVAILSLAAGCGPIGGDDEDEEPTARADGTASPAATPHGGPVQVHEGASPAGGTEAVAEDGTPASGASRTPSAQSTEDATRSAGPTPTPTPPTVEGCEEPEELPDVQGRRNRQTKADADEGVNLRAGPGKDCDIVQTLGPGTPVEVRSGPVLADDIVWVKIRVDDSEGWVSEELLEPAQD